VCSVLSDSGQEMENNAPYLFLWILISFTLDRIESLLSEFRSFFWLIIKADKYPETLKTEIRIS